MLLINILASYSDLLRLFPTAGMELSMDVVQCLKLFNSRTCQLILGAGARQMVGLKSINVKHLGNLLKLITKLEASLKLEAKITNSKTGVQTCFNFCKLASSLQT